MLQVRESSNGIGQGQEGIVCKEAQFEIMACTGDLKMTKLFNKKKGGVK